MYPAGIFHPAAQIGEIKKETIHTSFRTLKSLKSVGLSPAVFLQLHQVFHICFTLFLESYCLQVGFMRSCLPHKGQFSNTLFSQSAVQVLSD